MSYRIHVAEPCLDGNEKIYVMDCLESSWISSRGKYIEQFEEMVADFCSAKHAVATNNGTTALHLALASLGICPGDEVIVPTLSYIASANAVRYCGATPVFVDCCMPHLTLDPAQVVAKITNKTRAIMSVPLYGHPVDLGPLLEIAEEYGLFVVEDAAEALGAKYRGRPVGSLGTCVTFSFFGNKIITTGEGGMIVTQDGDLANRLRLLRGQGVSPTRRYWHTEVGFNYRMTNICAAIGCAQMERIDYHLSRRREVADWYFEALKFHDDIFVLPYQAAWAHHCYWMFTLTMRDHVGVQRDAVIQAMERRGIETRPVFYPMHSMPPYQYDTNRYPVADRYALRGISLPTHAGLSRVDVDLVCRELMASIQEVSSQIETSLPRAA